MYWYDDGYDDEVRDRFPDAHPQPEPARCQFCDRTVEFVECGDGRCMPRCDSCGWIKCAVCGSPYVRDNGKLLKVALAALACANYSIYLREMENHLSKRCEVCHPSVEKSAYDDQGPGAYDYGWNPPQIMRMGKTLRERWRALEGLTFTTGASVFDFETIPWNSHALDCIRAHLMERLVIKIERVYFILGHGYTHGWAVISARQFFQRTFPGRTELDEQELAGLHDSVEVNTTDSGALRFPTTEPWHETLNALIAARLSSPSKKSLVVDQADPFDNEPDESEPPIRTRKVKRGHRRFAPHRIAQSMRDDVYESTTTARWDRCQDGPLWIGRKKCPQHVRSNKSIADHVAIRDGRQDAEARRLTAYDDRMHGYDVLLQVLVQRIRLGQADNWLCNDLWTQRINELGNSESTNDDEYMRVCDIELRAKRILSSKFCAMLDKLYFDNYLSREDAQLVETWRNKQRRHLGLR